MKTSKLATIVLAVALCASSALASTFVLVEPSFGKYGKGLQLSYFSMDTQPGPKLAIGAGFSFMDIQGGGDNPDGSILLIMPGITFRYLTPVWLMPEVEAVVNVGYESYTEKCDETLNESCPEGSGMVLGGTLRQKVSLVMPWRFTPVVGAGVFETYNFTSELYPYDYGLLVSAGFQF